MFKQLKAGDTSSTALNFLFLMLAMHENVQHSIVKEINEVFGEYKDLIIDYEKLSELKYVEMVIKETLRLFSPATGKLGFMFFALNAFPSVALSLQSLGIFREVKTDVNLGRVGSGEFHFVRISFGSFNEVIIAPQQESTIWNCLKALI